MSDIAAGIVGEVRALGLRLEPLPDGHLYIEPKGRLTPELRARLVAHKAGVLAFLRGQPANEAKPARKSATRRPTPRGRTVYWTAAQIQTLVATVRAQLVGQKSHGEALDLALCWLSYQGQILLGDA